jgi:hypothetical protein
MAEIIEFYIPSGFQRTAPLWLPREQRGKVIPFRTPQKKSA